MLTETEIRAFVRRNNWRYAKTMPRFPHWYTLRTNAESEFAFLAFVEHIRAYGYDENFFRLQLRYFDFDGHKYWTMGSEVPETTLINRAVLTRAERPATPHAQSFVCDLPVKKENQVFKVNSVFGPEFASPDGKEDAFIHDAILDNSDADKAFRDAATIQAIADGMSLKDAHKLYGDQ